MAVVLACWLPVPWAEAGPLAKPIRFVAHKTDKTRLTGQIKSFDEQGFVYDDNAGEQDIEVPWTDLVAADIYLLHQRIYQQQPVDGKTWLQLGQRLWSMDNGRSVASRALIQAVRLDDSLKEAADAIRAGEDPVMDDAEPTNKKAWKSLDDAQKQKEVDALKALGDQAREKFCPRLKLYETNRFVFFSDLPPNEARSWQQLLDRMYDRMTDMFGLPRHTNIWKGKAGLFIFAKRDDFHSFANIIGTGEYPDWAVGLCHQFGDGRVVINFYRSPDKWNFAHTLVHEATHGFVWRYRSRQRVPSWVNEGLAEWVACALVPAASNIRSARVDLAARFREGQPTLGGMFEADRIDPPQYKMAMTLTDVMVQLSSRRYVDFFNAIKDGKPWEQALEEDYGLSVDKLLIAYSRALGMNTVVRP
ncbi:hypothetical protein HED60_02220 [Planctomycetales bacterium ZRK34]|nr:hypothetical protein HED60_02220 [Planctomycetales bacterium ZRK34]